MNRSWGIGDWAAEAEREEAEEKEREAAAAAAAAAAPIESFPTLGESVSMKPKKKKQQQTYSLAELTIGKSVGPGSRGRSMSDSRGLTTEEMLTLPTGPRDRSGEEDPRGGLGGAFRDYRDYNRMDREQNRSGYGSGGGFDRDREGSGFLRDRERDEPSRADDSSDWSSMKKPVVPSGFDGERRGSRFSDRDPAPPSRADEAGNWGLAKKSLPLTNADPRASGRRDSFDETKLSSRADEADNWGLSKKVPPAPLPRAGSGQDVHSRADDAGNWSSLKRGPSLETKQDSQMQDTRRDSERQWGRRTDLQLSQGVGEPQRKPLVIAPKSIQPPPRQSSLGVESEDASDVAATTITKVKPNPFGDARPREDILSERGSDLPRTTDDAGLREQESRPSSSHSSRPNTSDVIQEPVAQAKTKVNPFGNAKPREVLLQERGKDWRRMDFDYEHRGVNRPETEDEVLLKQEIKRLTELSKQDKEASDQQMNGTIVDESGSDQVDVQAILEELHMKEKELENLVRALDDKVRFSQKVGDRPRSRSGWSDVGRSYDMLDRPGSRPGSRAGSRPGSRSGRSDAGWSYDQVERPGSQSGRRNVDSSESPRSHSGYGGVRTIEAGERWSRGGRQFEGSRNQESLERTGLWAGSNESGRSFDSLQRPRQHPSRLPTEVDGASEYPQEAGGGADVWTRTNEAGRDRQGGWGNRTRGSNQGWTRRF